MQILIYISFESHRLPSIVSGKHGFYQIGNTDWHHNLLIERAPCYRCKWTVRSESWLTIQKVKQMYYTKYAYIWMKMYRYLYIYVYFLLIIRVPKTTLCDVARFHVAIWHISFADVAPFDVTTFVVYRCNYHAFHCLAAKFHIDWLMSHWKMMQYTSIW